MSLFILAWLHFIVWQYSFTQGFDNHQAPTILPLLVLVSLSSFLASGFSSTYASPSSSLLRCAVLLFLVVISSFSNPWVYYTALFAFSVECVDVILHRRSWYQRIWRAGLLLHQRLAFVGLLTFVGFTALEPVLQAVQWPTHHIRFLLHSLGIPHGVTESGITFSQGGTSLTYGTSVNHLDMFPLVLAAAICAYLIFRRLSGLRTGVLISVLAIIIGFHAFYISALAVMVLEHGQPLFLGGTPLAHAIYYLPLFIAMAAASTLSPSVSLSTFRPPPLRYLATLLVLGCIISTSLNSHDPGIKKEGRVAIDESHSDWEWAGFELNKSEYGVKSTYSFYWLARILGLYFPTVHIHEDGPLDLETLRKYDVWILKTPTKPYENDERAAIRKYVQQGGGLWLIGDHTNIFGMNTYLNSIARDAGISFRMDSMSTRGSSHQYWRNTQVNPHPVIQHVPDFLWATSCSLGVDPTRADTVLAGRGLYQDLGQYSVNTFFGNHQQDPDERFGAFAQIAVARYGKGRICAFTDSTTLSSFTMSIPGKPELAVGTVEWLNRENRYFVGPWVLTLSIGAAFALLVFMILKRYALCAVLVAMFGGAMVGGIVARTATRASYPFPESRVDYRKVAFMLDSLERLPLHYERTHAERSPESIHTFYVWIQRMGMFPQVAGYSKKPWDSDALVIVSAGRAVSEAPRLEKYLKEGGQCLLMLGHSHHEPEDLLRLGEQVSLRIPIVEAATVIPPPSPDEDRHGTTLSISGDRLGLKSLVVPMPRYLISDPSCIANVDGASEHGVAQVYKVGEGTLLVVTSYRFFSNLVFGSTTDIPTKEQEMAYKAEYAIFEELFGLEAYRR